MFSTKTDYFKLVDFQMDKYILTWFVFLGNGRFKYK